MFLNTQETTATINTFATRTRAICLYLNTYTFVKLKLHSLWLVELPFKRINDMI